MRAARSSNGFHNFDVSLASQYFKANAFRMAANQQVKSGIRDVEVFDGQLVKIGRKSRVRESNRSFRGANRDSQRCSEQQENASRGPSLRRTSDRIESRAGGICSLVKTAEKLRQTAELDVKTCFVQPAENLIFARIDASNYTTFRVSELRKTFIPGVKIILGDFRRVLSWCSYFLVLFFGLCRTISAESF